MGGRLRQQQSLSDSGIRKKSKGHTGNFARWQSDLGEMEKTEAQMKTDLERLRAVDKKFHMGEAHHAAKHVTDAPPTLEPITTAEPAEITTPEPIEVTTIKPAAIQ